MDEKEMKQGLERIVKHIYEEKRGISYSELVPHKTALVVIDMVNGFTREGILMSPRVEALIPEIANIMTNCKDLGIQTVAFADSHSEKSPEFAVYGGHCKEGTSEAELVAELQAIGGYFLIKKNSANGFLEPKFQAWLSTNPQVTDFVVIGDCTDICILQFCLTLKAYFNMLNRESRIVVPINAVDTFDFDLHQAELTHVMALYNLSLNGIEVVADLERT